MSDGALSQDEIDALLAGVDSSGGMGAPAPSSSSSIPDGERRALQEFLSSTVQAQSSNLSMMTGSSVSVQLQQLDSVGKDAFLQKLPDMAVSVQANFSSGIVGEHSYVMSKDTAQRIASMMNKEENIELDEMAMSVIGEVVSQLSGSQITALSDKTGNKGISSEPPAATFQPKGMVGLPAGEFARATYQIDFGDGQSSTVWEVFGASVVKDIARSLGGEAPGMDMGANLGMGGGAMGGFPGMGGGGGGMQMPSMGGAMGGFGMGGSAMMGQAPTNVQSIQFPSLVPQSPHGEHGNIGLIMDVYMEMTVELGRTRKLIKEILGMGEGTIIELDKLAGEPVDILVNHKLIAKGEVVVIDENFGVRVTEIVSPMERMSDMG